MNALLLIAFTCISLPLASADHGSKRTDIITRFDELLKQRIKFITTHNQDKIITQINLNTVIVDPKGEQCLVFGNAEAQKGIKGENTFYYCTPDLQQITERLHPKRLLPTLKAAFFNKNRTIALLIPNSDHDSSVQSNYKRSNYPLVVTWYAFIDISNFTIDNVKEGDDIITCFGTHRENKKWKKCIISLVPNNGTPQITYE